MFGDVFKKKKKQYITIQPTKNTPGSKTDVSTPIEKCPECLTLLLKNELERNLFVCPKCTNHFSIPAHKRIHSLFDEDSFVETDESLTSLDPLNFPTYAEKIAADRKKTNLSEAVVTGSGTINGIPAIVAVMDSRFRMGSMGSAVGEKITRAIELAIEKKCPFLLFSASGGARMQEGVLSLMQMAKTSVALNKLSELGLLYISILTNPTTGGVSASFASLGDINIAEPQALIGFAGRRIIEQTIHEKLPEDFQTAEFLLKHGQLDLITNRLVMKEQLTTILKIHGYGKEES